MRYEDPPPQLGEQAPYAGPDPLDQAQLPSSAVPFPHGRVACPRCQAHNDAHSPVCFICGAALPGNLPHLVSPAVDRSAHAGYPRARLGTRDRTQLTPREWEVARLVARGLSDAEVATSLAIRPSTVHNHLVHVFQKAGVHRRADLARWVEERGDREARDVR